MRKQVSNFGGGISNNSKSGLPNSARFIKHLDIFSDDDSVTLNPAPTKVSGAIVTDLVKWIVDALPATTDRYGYGDAGNIYNITSSEVWTLDRSGATIGNGAAGQGICALDNALYYSTATTIGRKYPLSGTPAYNDDVFTNGVDNLDLSVTASGNTYTPPVAISETATNLLYFTPTSDPLKTAEFYVTSKGTGNWTVTVHDASNNSLGTATVANGSLTNGTMNDFNFSTPIRINIGSTYHFHVTSTVADGTLQTGTASDLTTAQYKTFFGILITSTDYHPMIKHTNGTGGTIVVGNGNYMAEIAGGITYDTTNAVVSQGNYDPNKIEILPGYNIRYLVKYNEFVVAMAWKGTTIDGNEDGMAFYWDGIQPYYNYSNPITGGSPNASINYKNRVLSILGSSAWLSLGDAPFKTIQPAPKLGNGKKVEVMPGAMSTWQNRAQIGIGANTDDSTGLIQGVYEFGNQSDRAISYTSVSTEVLSFGYTISTGDEQGTTMKIGCVAGFGNAMYIAWKSQAGTFGVDKVSKGNNPATTGSWESLIDDDTGNQQGFISAPQKEKEANQLAVQFVALPTGCTVIPKYKIDRATNWSYGPTAVAGDTNVSVDINTRYHEIEYGFDITATVNYPTILGLYFEFNPLVKERDNN